MEGKKYKVLIVEDELLIADNIQLMMEDEGYEVCPIAMSVSDAKRIILNHQPDLALLDIQLKGEADGIDLGRWIADEIKIPFLFLTSQNTEGYVKRAFKTNPAAYVLKPITVSNLLLSVKLAIFNHEQDANSETVTVKVGTEQVVLSVDEIIYLASDHVYIQIHTKDKRYLVRSTMRDLVEQLGPQFVQTHRGYAINSKCITKLSTAYLHLSNDIEIPIGRRFKNDLKGLI